ncbi:MAG: ester cyclase [Desulfofustis sp.]|jgi:hypothetical protein|nr:ester cyclase [Desulfofustis sp.]
MVLTEHEAIRAYARMMNTGDLRHFEPFIADDIELKSQVQSEPVQGKQEFLEHMAKNLERFTDDAPLWAEIGEIYKSGRLRPCAVLSQYSRENMVASATIELRDNQVSRLNLFFIPSPEEAALTGEVPV